MKNASYPGVLPPSDRLLPKMSPHADKMVQAFQRWNEDSGARGIR